jgi:ribosomal protein S18 acetylase RimI-like enzyme
MEILIEVVNKTNFQDVGNYDGEFVIESELILRAENNQIWYSVVDRPSAKKRYDTKDIDYATYINHPEKAVFLAYADGKAAGQIILQKHWNNFAYIYDIVVDENFRRLGIGRALIAEARRWAEENGLPGIMLETQTNNVPACHFYESCGFKLGGFDKYLYSGQDTNTDEVAMFWYLHF